MGKGLFATSTGLDSGGELSERIGKTFTGGYLSLSVCGGDPQLEATAAELCEQNKELHSQLFLGIEFKSKGGR